MQAIPTTANYRKVAEDGAIGSVERFYGSYAYKGKGRE